MSNIHLIVFLALVVLVWYIVRQDRKANQRAQERWATLGPTQHCMTCGEDFKPPLNAPLRGSGVVELALWFTFVGGLIYSIWRRSSKFKLVCPTCHATTVVPIDSKAAKAHSASLAKA